MSANDPFLPWEEYLNSFDSNSHDLDLACLLPTRSGGRVLVTVGDLRALVAAGAVWRGYGGKDERKSTADPKHVAALRVASVVSDNLVPEGV